MGEYWAAESGGEERSCGDDLLIGSMVASAVDHVRCKNLGRYGEGEERGECWRAWGRALAIAVLEKGTTMRVSCSIIVVGNSEKLVVCLRIS